MSDLAMPLIQHFEGCRLTAYKDTQGLWTIGWGHLLKNQDTDWTGHTITQAEADEILEGDMAYAHTLAQQFPHYADLMNDVRQAVCVSMCYQMGNKPLHWLDFIAALEIPDYAAAADAGVNSKWAYQTPARAQLQMAMLRTGEWELPT